MADGILAAVNENGNIDRFIDTKGGVHYIEPKRYEESVAKIDAAATKAKETVNSATEAVSECKAQTGACTQETARAKEIADTVESRITGIEGDVAALRDSVSPSYLGGGNVSILGCTVKVDCWIVATRILIVKFSYVSGSMTSSGACEIASDAALVLPEYLRPKEDIRVTAFTSLRFGKSVGAVVEPSGAVKLYFSTSSGIRGYGFETCACCIPLAL